MNEGLDRRIEALVENLLGLKKISGAEPHVIHEICELVFPISNAAEVDYDTYISKIFAYLKAEKIGARLINDAFLSVQKSVDNDEGYLKAVFALNDFMSKWNDHFNLNYVPKAKFDFLNKRLENKNYEAVERKILGRFLIDSGELDPDLEGIPKLETVLEAYFNLPEHSKASISQLGKQTIERLIKDNPKVGIADFNQQMSKLSEDTKSYNEKIRVLRSYNTELDDEEAYAFVQNRAEAENTHLADAQKYLCIALKCADKRIKDLDVKIKQLANVKELEQAKSQRKTYLQQRIQLNLNALLFLDRHSDHLKNKVELFSLARKGLMDSVNALKEVNALDASSVLNHVATLKRLDDKHNTSADVYLGRSSFGLGNFVDKLYIEKSMLNPYFSAFRINQSTSKYLSLAKINASLYEKYNGKNWAHNWSDPNTIPLAAELTRNTINYGADWLHGKITSTSGSWGAALWNAPFNLTNYAIKFTNELLFTGITFAAKLLALPYNLAIKFLDSIPASPKELVRPTNAKTKTPESTYNQVLRTSPPPEFTPPTSVNEEQKKTEEAFESAAELYLFAQLTISEKVLSDVIEELAIPEEITDIKGLISAFGKCDVEKLNEYVQKLNSFSSKDESADELGVIKAYLQIKLAQSDDPDKVRGCIDNLSKLVEELNNKKSNSFFDQKQGGTLKVN